VELDDYLAAVSVEARALTEGTEREYDVARRLWRLGMEGISEETAHVGHPLWLIWGHLTDLVDGPGGASPGAEAAAAETMRKAASEWLRAVNQPDRLSEYFDRWVYEECGYPRRDGTP
jgi:hypothetical protein